MLVALKKMRRGDKFIYDGLLCTFLGFVRGEYSEIRVYNEWEIGEWSDPPYASVRLDIDRQVIRVINRGRDMFIAEKEIYVHQLQHALRLAGVGKEIEL